MFLTGLVGHAFTIYAITLPEKNFNIYVEIFTSAGFSPMDFYMGSVMATVNFTSSIVAFVGLKRVSKKLEKLCQDLDRFNSRNHIYQEKMYTGKGNIKQYKNSN
jgi:NAD/NADP transhydrogenase beta subunit